MQLVDRPHGWLRVLTQRTHLLPGLGVAAGAAAASLLVSQWLPSVSPLLLAIAAGAVLANTAGVAPSVRAGLAVAAKRWLRVGVALLGFQLALTDIAGLGWRMVVVVVGIVSGWHRPDPRTRPVAQGRAGPAPAHRVRLLLSAARRPWLPWTGSRTWTRRRSPPRSPWSSSSAPR